MCSDYLFKYYGIAHKQTKPKTNKMMSVVRIFNGKIDRMYTESLIILPFLDYKQENLIIEHGKFQMEY